MKSAVRLVLFGTIFLAVGACQGLVPANASPTSPANGDSTPAGFVLASIEGVVWHDLCDSGADGEPALTLTPPGCIREDSGLGPFHGDGVHQPAEPGLPGVTVTLSSGTCPGADVLQTTLSDTKGAYVLSGLDAGAYCVSIDPTSAANLSLLMPGVWTHPNAGNAAADVSLHAGEAKTGVDFGWDEQFYPLHAHAAIWDNQGQMQVIDTGVAVDLQTAPSTIFMPKGGVAQGRIFVYASDSFHPTPTVMMSTPDGPHQVAFIAKPDYTLAVWPGRGDQPAKLAWSEAPTPPDDKSIIYVSDLAGTAVHAVYSEAFQPSFPTHLLVQGWSADGQTLLFSREPWGIGGYIPFDGASSLYRLDPGDGQVTPIIEFGQQGSSGLCLDALSTDGSRVASHCPRGAITIKSLVDGQVSTITPPSGLTQDYLFGSVRFSPDGSRVAYASAAANPDLGNTWVAVSDGMAGASHSILETPTGYYHVVTWLDNQTLLLQGLSVPCGDGCSGDSLWTVEADGSGLVQIAQGDFITLTNIGQP